MADLKPRTKVPDLEVQTLEGSTWRLQEQAPQNFTMFVFYRGLHCPICKSYMRELDGKVGEFTARGVDVIAVSSDSRERAEKAKQDWGLNHVKIGYGLPIAKAREGGLYVSRAIKDSEPAEFSEPGLFLVKPDRTLYCASVNTMPFARASFNDMLNAVDFCGQEQLPGARRGLSLWG